MHHYNALFYEGIFSIIRILGVKCQLENEGCQLFHHFFNHTPYDLLLDYRMNKAHQLLTSTHCQVAIAADFVGYAHASNFSTAFIKYFGFSPKNIAKNQADFSRYH